MDDERIVQLLLERREEGLTEAASRYRERCFRIARRILGNDEDAEECVNDVFLEAWNSIPPQHPLNLSAFLFTLVQRRAIDRLRHRTAGKRGGDREELPFEELENLFPVEGDPADEMEKELLAETLREFVDELKPEQRNLCISRYWYAEPIDTLCERFGWGKSRVKSALHRLRIRLWKKLKEEGLI